MVTPPHLGRSMPFHSCTAVYGDHRRRGDSCELCPTHLEGERIPFRSLASPELSDRTRPGEWREIRRDRGPEAVRAFQAGRHRSEPRGYSVRVNEPSRGGRISRRTCPSSPSSQVLSTGNERCHSLRGPYKPPPIDISLRPCSPKCPPSLSSVPIPSPSEATPSTQM